MDPVTKEVHYPSKAIAQEALDGFGETNKELEELAAKMRKLHCGNRSTGGEVLDGAGKMERLQVNLIHGPKAETISSLSAHPKVSDFHALDTRTPAVEYTAQRESVCQQKKS